MPELSPAVVILALLPVIGTVATVAGLVLRKQGMEKADRRVIFDKIESLAETVNDGFRTLGERQARTEARLDFLSEQQRAVHSAVNGGLEDRISRAVRTAMERNTP